MPNFVAKFGKGIGIESQVWEPLVPRTGNPEFKDWEALVPRFRNL